MIACSRSSKLVERKRRDENRVKLKGRETKAISSGRWRRRTKPPEVIDRLNFSSVCMKRRLKNFLHNKSTHTHILTLRGKWSAGISATTFAKWHAYIIIP